MSESYWKLICVVGYFAAIVAVAMVGICEQLRRRRERQERRAD